MCWFSQGKYQFAQARTLSLMVHSTSQTQVKSMLPKLVSRLSKLKRPEYKLF